MDDKIRRVLRLIESDQRVRVLYACESGSRAWGFASADSDYDVRFIYVRQKDWYLSINLEQKRDVIELPISSGLDVNGWDIRKALQLLRRSNPPLLEWLGSPIVYLDKYSLASRMRELVEICYSPVACQYHYYKMAKGNFRRSLKGDQVRLKKYFYVLRPLLAVIWLERGMGVVPTEFGRLIEGVVKSEELRAAIEELLVEKREGKELDFGPRIPLISDFLEQELSRMETNGFVKHGKNCPAEILNEFFRDVLNEVWG